MSKSQLHWQNSYAIIVYPCSAPTSGDIGCGCWTRIGDLNQGRSRTWAGYIHLSCGGRLSGWHIWNQGTASLPFIVFNHLTPAWWWWELVLSLTILTPHPHHCPWDIGSELAERMGGWPQGDNYSTWLCLHLGIEALTWHWISHFAFVVSMENNTITVVVGSPFPMHKAHFMARMELNYSNLLD